MMMRVCCALFSGPIILSTSITRNRFCLPLPYNNNSSHFQSKIYGLTSITHPNPIFQPNYKTTGRNANSPIFSNLCVANAQAQPSDDFIVVNFYHFVFIKDPNAEVSNHLSFLQYSGPSKHALAYVEWLREDYRFSDILVQISPAFNGHAFPKLKLRYKPSLVQLEGGISHLPLLDPSMRATPLAPSEWRKRLEMVHEVEGMSNSALGSKYVLLDVRNGYEWDIGNFIGAQRPDTECFRSTSCGVSDAEAIASDPLANADKNTTQIFMYCTGGIRCDVYSTILREQGFQNLYTLMGGISHYLSKEGPIEWVGNLFVFDDRLSLPPSAYNSDATAAAYKTYQGPKKNLYANCYICGSHVSELRHRNCANLDCNLLFLCCMDCTKDLRGCCCMKCTTAPRLRPVLPGNQRYKKWHTYREMEMQVNLTV
ncbi:rhodanese-like domain-containing protein 8, chloroplastic isoform X2 [Ricinus communis]|uniref:rhodanese-like domain-containing protein 8, chloroplastic isoform X2 n=1 Tax=Ricinus communis TaxID=3988 RepID=UPI00201B1164|nr:rhodanese-like domain-containing protein 8, chloroplastic isoform X2 [Ricinus communis]